MFTVINNTREKLAGMDIWYGWGRRDKLRTFGRGNLWEKTKEKIQKMK